MTIRLNGSTSGYTELDAQAVAGSNTLRLPANNGSAYQLLKNGATPGQLEYGSSIVSGTAQGWGSAAIDFTGIPSWAKRVTVMFNSVSTTGTSSLLIQIGDPNAGIQTVGYSSACQYGSSGSIAHTFSTAGFIVYTFASSDLKAGLVTLCSMGSPNVWVASGSLRVSNTQLVSCSGDKALAAPLDRVRITTVNGTDTFDVGSINILYE